MGSWFEGIQTREAQLSVLQQDLLCIDRPRSSKLEPEVGPGCHSHQHPTSSSWALHPKGLIWNVRVEPEAIAASRLEMMCSAPLDLA